jgi:[NiFe] hydrogenase assembly HybE family chaperone
MGASTSCRPCKVNPSRRIEKVFRNIAHERMAGLPIVNPALSVKAVGFRDWHGMWAGALVTPWSINLLVLPGGSSEFRVQASGASQCWRFPSGDYEYQSVFDEHLGHYQMCSLFSPVHEFVSQAAAVAAANAALAEVFRAPDASHGLREGSDKPSDEGGQSGNREGLARRAFLRGCLLRD